MRCFNISRWAGQGDLSSRTLSAAEAPQNLLYLQPFEKCDPHKSWFAAFNWKIQQLMFLWPITCAKPKGFFDTATLISHHVLRFPVGIKGAWRPSVSFLLFLLQIHGLMKCTHKLPLFTWALTVQIAEHANSCHVLTPESPSVAGAFGFVAFVIELRG